ncbi:hypothetical protein H4R99_000218 [Coemansia sp. RSA 1722]|nr:hypothetical protein LPJ57_006540 [Coemansia sp. RSA 486]KAJ2238294.1 hypothetical protein IWW45_000124 [Coemansia sp. RSA 485]KAJ2606584.1 hypothetical protein H4R99_000218 [Coemansia sp. RSA 1722]
MLLERIPRKPASAWILRHWHSQAPTNPRRTNTPGGGIIETKYIPSADSTERFVPVSLVRRKFWTKDEIQRLKSLVLARNPHERTISENDWKEIARAFPGRSSSGCKQKLHSLVKKYNLKGFVRDNSERLSDEELVYDMRLIRQPWDEIVRVFGGKYTVEQCKNIHHNVYIKKYHRNMRMMKKKAEQDRIRPLVPKNITGGWESTLVNGVARPWGEAEDQKLKQLLREYGEYSYRKIGVHFIGFRRSTIAQALDRMLRYPDAKTGKWTKDERTMFMRLYHKHGDDWESISKEMPTRRTPRQCKAFYHHRHLRSRSIKRPWSEEESRQLELLVKLYSRPRDSGVGESVRPVMATDTKMLFRAVSQDSTMSPKLKKLMLALKQDSGNAVALTDTQPTAVDNNNNNINGSASSVVIDWPLIASYMLSRSQSQCYVYWKYVLQPKKKQPGVYRGPWSVEEDAKLYQLHLETPGRWAWIAQHMPRLRTRFDVRYRYIKYIDRYVKMLRECRGPEWDPMADGFEEVHMRCEIRAWYRQESEGYRPEDKNSCPYDLDLTGYRK